MLQPWQIERCRAIISSDHAINFEVRMVAEIYLYWTVYEHLIQESVDLLKSVAALQDWRRKWEFVLGMLHFLLCYLILANEFRDQSNRDLSFSQWASISPIYFSTNML